MIITGRCPICGGFMELDPDGGYCIKCDDYISAADLRELDEEFDDSYDDDPYNDPGNMWPLELGE